MLPIALAILSVAEVPASPVPDGELRAAEEVVRTFVAAWNRGEPPPGLRAREGDARHREHTRLELDIAGLRLKESPRSATVEGTLVGTFKPAPGRLWPVEPWKQDGARSPISIHLIKRPVEEWVVWIRSAWDAPRPVP